jgi:hypothetical protein
MDVTFVPANLKGLEHTTLKEKVIPNVMDVVCSSPFKLAGTKVTSIPYFSIVSSCVQFANLKYSIIKLIR